MRLRELILVALGKREADLIIKNTRIVNTFIGEIEAGNVAIYQDKIAGIGDYSLAREVIDLKGDYLAPALIDGHTHLESSMLHPAQYARAIVPHGTLALVTDLHEISNVSGLKGIEFIMRWGRRLPLDMFFMVPSCVPATSLETSGALIGIAQVKALLRKREVLGLGEMMNFPGVLQGVEEVLTKISLAQSKIVDGHAPGLSNEELNAYLVPGILSDHETTALAEGSEKLKKGMFLMIREGSSEKNLETLLPLVTDKTWGRCFFVVDDRSCSDLFKDGDMDAVVRKAIRLGLHPIRAIQMATINPAQYFKLRNLGAISPGYFANLITFKDLSTFKVDKVFYQGRLVAKEGRALFPVSRRAGDELTDSVKIKPFNIERLRIAISGDSYPVIEVVPGQIITRQGIEKVRKEDGVVVPDLEKDILKLAVVERHKATGNIGLGLVRGFSLKKGALASSIAHDSHNIVAVGTTDLDIYCAIKEIESLRGGLVACAEGKVLASLPLPIAGLLSPEPLEVVVAKFERLEKTARELGSTLPSPFTVLSFLALPVIPELRLTDMGLVDVVKFKLIKEGGF